MSSDTTGPKRIFVTGASGYAGARIYNDLKMAFPNGAILGTFGSNQLFPELMHLDLTDETRIRSTVLDFAPDWIVHLAAIPNQTSCEKDINRAHQVNVNAVRSLVKAANTARARFLFLSSESAFEETLYGKLKREGEFLSKESEFGWTILQPAMIFGLSPNIANDRPYNRLLRAIESKQSASFDVDLKFFPTWLGNLSEVIIHCLRRDIKNETIPVVGDMLSSRFDLATHVMSRFGLGVLATHSGKPGSLAPLTQEKLKELELPYYSTEKILDLVRNETLKHFGA